MGTQTVKKPLTLVITLPHSPNIGLFDPIGRFLLTFSNGHSQAKILKFYQFLNFPHYMCNLWFREMGRGQVVAVQWMEEFPAHS